MQPVKSRLAEALRILSFAALVTGVVLTASSLSSRDGAPSTEAASSAQSQDRPLSRQIYMPIVRKAEATPTPTRTPIPTPTPQPPPGSSPGVYLGAYVDGVPENLSALSSFQTTVGKKMAIVMYYHGWAGNSPFNASAAGTVAKQGSIPMITWEPWDWTAGANQPAYSNASIAAGNWDSYITSYAQAVKSYGKPVLIRFAHEMNFPPPSGYPWAVGTNGNTAQSYVAAWRHVHDVFVRVGATNALWVWSPIIEYAGTAPYASIYPGDSYVDWIGIDGYNGGTAVNWGGWLWFSQIFGQSYQSLTQLSPKPLMIAETASAEQGGSKATWISDAMLTQLPQYYPRIKGFVWFNQNRTWETDWRIESSASSLAAYRQAAANAYYKSSYP